MAKRSKSEDTLEEFSPLVGLQEQTVVQEEVLAEVESRPKFFSKEWTAFIMGQFTKDELEDDAPRVHGLRRVAQQVIGPITKSRVCVHQCPSRDNDQRAVVSYALSLMVLNPSHPACGNELELEDVSDVFAGNTNAPYHVHATATAATKAEARVLRKALGLNKIAAEEQFDRNATTYEVEVPTFEGKATDAQIVVADLMFKRLKICPQAFLKEHMNGLSKHELTEEQMQEVTKKLNSYSKEKVPEHLQGYREW